MLKPKRASTKKKEAEAILESGNVVSEAVEEKAEEHREENGYCVVSGA